MTVQSFFILLGKHPLVSERARSATQIVRGFYGWLPPIG